MLRWRSFRGEAAPRAGSTSGTAGVPTGPDTTRLEAFSDGVIAIAITLLVLEVRVPGREQTADGRELWSVLAEKWPSYLGFVLSFVIIGIMWANHHNVFRLIGRVNHELIVLNTLLLFCIAFLPFPTALLAEYLGHHGQRAATIVYSGWLFATASSFYTLWWYASRDGHLLATDADPLVVRTITRRFRVGPPSYLLAFLLSFVYPPASLALIGLLAGLYLLPSSDG